MKRRTCRRALATMWAVGLALGLGVVTSASAEAQARRGVSQRQTPIRENNATDQRRQRQRQLVLDRFARRVGEALHLDDADTRRLMRELQASRAQRGRLLAQAQAIRRELAHLIEEEPADEERIGALMDEVLQLDVERAEVAIDEQRRLSEFLRPLERARLIWFQQQAARQALQRQTDRPIRG